eukprot:15453829-Alexandrium_andersonii.AAC.1
MCGLVLRGVPCTARRGAVRRGAAWRGARGVHGARARRVHACVRECVHAFVPRIALHRVIPRACVPASMRLRD